jgi:NAD(P)-dependent dehydrogenase (short-subunit alcohol dehydrogenase family)
MNNPSLPQLISLEGKHALITGSGGGIGKAIARRYAEAGARLTLVDLNEETLRNTKSELAEFGVEINILVVNLSAKENIDDLWNQLNGDEPDVLVNNAGIYPFKHFLDADEAFYQQVMDINLDSVYRMCHHMIEKRIKIGGAIINIGSIEAVLPFKEDLAIYSVSKAGVIALTRALAREHAKDGFQINAILPGGITTPGTMSAAKQVLKGKFSLLKTGYDFLQRLPIGRMGDPDEPARIALVLASELASYVHGAAIPVDGGFLAS